MHCKVISWTQFDPSSAELIEQASNTRIVGCASPSSPRRYDNGAVSCMVR